jgi:hypothetical protein
MKKAWMKIGFVAAMAFAAVALAPVAEAVSVAVDLGTGAPPATVGGFAMTAFGDDPRPEFGLVLDVASPLGGTVDFGALHDQRTIGSGWATWSHGYAGDVYYTGGAASSTMTLPAGTAAFYFYAEPNPFSVFTMTATSADGTFLTFDVDGSSGAHGWGFYDAAGLVSITVTSSIDFAVGEFGISDGAGAPIPEPSTVVLLGLGLAALGVKRLRRS